MKKNKQILGIIALVMVVSAFVSSCSSSNKYACPNKIEILP